MSDTNLKNAYFADVDGKVFSTLKVTKTTYPERRDAGRAPRSRLA
jgi:hypothetical protein